MDTEEIVAPRQSLSRIFFAQSNRNRTLLEAPTEEEFEPDQTQAERNYHVQEQMMARYDELETLIEQPGEDDDARLAWLVERRSIEVFTLQRAFRDEVLRRFRGDAAGLRGPVAPVPFTRPRHVAALEGRTSAEMLKTAEGDLAARRAARHRGFLDTLIDGIRAGQERGAAQKARYCLIGRDIVKRERKAEKTRIKEQEKAERGRLRALKENRYDEYVAMVKDMKNDRLNHLLQETETYLAGLAHSIGGAGAARAAGGEGGYYELVHGKELRDVPQPRCLVGGTLKPYQLEGVRWLASLHDGRLNGILADEMGLGKTIQTIAFLAYLKETKEDGGPHLVLAPLATIANWMNELTLWCPSLDVICYTGNPKRRRELRPRVTSGRYNVLLTSYDYMLKDVGTLKQVDWGYVVIDEGHRIKNHQSRLSTILKTSVSSAHRLIVTGTPLQNNLNELWALLNFILPRIFDSADNFEQWFAAPFARLGPDAALEATEEERLVIIGRLHQILRPFLLRRVKTDVARQLPRKTEAIIRCPLSGWQQHLYSTVQAQGRALFTGSGASSRSLSNVEMQLRKVCLHPYLFRDAPEPDEGLWRASGKVELLDRILPKLQRTGHRVLLFSQMKQLLDVIALYLEYRGTRYLRLDGDTRAELRQGLLDDFNAPSSPYFMFILTTRAGGLGINLQTADTVIIFDSDWNPQMDAQAQARAHRIGQTSEVRVLRLVAAAPIEERIIAAAEKKLGITNVVISAGQFGSTGASNAKEHRAELKRLILEADAGPAAAIPSDAEINAILARGPDEGATFAEMDREREAAWIDQWEGNPPPRLDTEVPQWVLDVEARQAAEREQLDLTVTEPRKRTTMVSYAEPGTDDEFMTDEEDVPMQDKEEDVEMAPAPAPAGDMVELPYVPTIGLEPQGGQAGTGV